MLCYSNICKEFPRNIMKRGWRSKRFGRQEFVKDQGSVVLSLLVPGQTRMRVDRKSWYKSCFDSHCSWLNEDGNLKLRSIFTYQNNNEFQTIFLNGPHKLREAIKRCFVVSEIQLPFHVVNVAVLNVLRRDLKVIKQCLTVAITGYRQA